VTIADRVLDYIRYNPDKTNREIARAIGSPEPSVRRATYQLEGMGRIHVGANSPHRNLIWRTAF
jgi:DNA-binding MarR family transcriptional regulator